MEVRGAIPGVHLRVWSAHSTTDNLPFTGISEQSRTLGLRPMAYLSSWLDQVTLVGVEVLGSKSPD